MEQEMPEDILGTCIAYEQGFGKGLEMSKHANPYCKFDHQWWAWDCGFSEGARKRANQVLKDRVVVQNENGTSVELVLLADK